MKPRIHDCAYYIPRPGFIHFYVIEDILDAEYFTTKKDSVYYKKVMEALNKSNSILVNYKKLARARVIIKHKSASLIVFEYSFKLESDHQEDCTFSFELNNEENIIDNENYKKNAQDCLEKYNLEMKKFKII